MTNFIPIFPLGIVVFPGEHLNLHIFESRYKQLVQECIDQKKPFGIPSVIDNKLQEFGTLVEIREISKVHDNGEMDIKTEGSAIFRILEVIKEVPGRLYSGAIVNYPHNNNESSPEHMRKLMVAVRELHQQLKVGKDFKKAEDEIGSYDVAHHVGLSLQEEYELLCLMDERYRQEYLKRHLVKVMPTVAGMEKLREKINLNGHFKDLKGFNL